MLKPCIGHVFDKLRVFFKLASHQGPLKGKVGAQLTGVSILPLARCLIHFGLPRYSGTIKPLLNYVTEASVKS